MTNDEILALVAQSMTSGIKQDGAKFTLPETMLVHFAKACYNRGYQAATDRFSRDFANVFDNDLQK
jgi:organic hydroperoxide reductase OsmC/OhrA